MTTKLSTKGQVILPKQIRQSLGWKPGTELVVESLGNRVVLRLPTEVPSVTLAELMGCAGYKGPALSLKDMEAAIAKGAREQR